MKASSIRFSKSNPDFYSTLSTRVNQYFKNNNISRYANSEMVIKTISMYLIYLVPYFLILTSVVTNLWAMAGLCIVMGIGIAGIGLSIMHDANHGAYSRKSWVNNLLGLSLNVVGGNAFNWRVQHNVLHHTYTNIHDVDEDISPRGILRMCPHGEWKSFHRFQHLYAWFFYGLMTIVWVLVKDFVRISKYQREGFIKNQKSTFFVEMAVLLASKAVYVGYIFVIPMMVLDLAWYQVLAGVLISHYVAGFILAIIFQPAHVIDGTEYPLPDNEGNLENSWAIHQLNTTTNFANKSRLFSWYVGGLNFQIEHHLFPNICHVHYRHISPIVEQTAKEFGIKYKSFPTFAGAIVHHAKLLKELGVRPTQEPALKAQAA